MCKCDLDLTPCHYIKIASSLLYWLGFKKDAGLPDLVKPVPSAHSVINSESNLQIRQAYINRRMSLEVGPEVPGSVWEFNHRNKEKRNVNGISKPPKTFQPVILLLTAQLRDSTHTSQELRLWISRVWGRGSLQSRSPPVDSDVDSPLHPVTIMQSRRADQPHV